MASEYIPSTSLELMQEIQHRVPSIEIRQEQIEALDAIQADEEAGRTASLIAMAPGVGKTVVMAADTRRRLLRNPQARGLFLCDSNYILGEARDSFQEIVGDQFHHALYGETAGMIQDYTVVFDSFQAMRRHRSAFSRNDFTFGLVDEGHHSKASTYEPTLDYFDFEHLLGVTATPDRLDTLDIRDIFGPETYSYPLAKAMAERRLAAVDYHVIADIIAETGIIEDSDGYIYSKKDFDRVVFAPKRDKEIMRIAQRYAESIKGPVKRAGFCKSIEQAEMFAQLFSDHGDESEAFHSGMSKRLQKKAYEEFKHGELSGLFTVSKFDEGINIPPVNQILFLRGTNSKRIFLQELGRGMRKTPTKKRLQALDFANNAEHLLMVDRVWQEVARYVGEPNVLDEEVFDIDLNHVHFNESTRNALKLLRTIDQKIYRPDQAVQAGSYLASRLARELKMTKPALLALARSIQVESQTFPTQSGSSVPYFLSEDVERLRTAYDRLF